MNKQKGIQFFCRSFALGLIVSFSMVSFLESTRLESASFAQSLTHMGGVGGGYSNTDPRFIFSGGQPIVSPVINSANLRTRIGFIQGPITPPLTRITLTIAPTEAASVILSPSYGSLQVDIPQGAFSETVELSIDAESDFPDSAEGPIQLSGTGVGVTIETDTGEEPDVPISYVFNYDEDAETQIDNENNLVTAYYWAEYNIWVLLQTDVDPSRNQVVSITPYIGTIQLMERIPPNDFSSAYFYPNPFQPHKGHTRVHLNNLPENTSVYIYTLSGELVRKLESSSSGQVLWDVRNQSGDIVSSGVYLMLLKTDKASTTLKVAVER